MSDVPAADTPLPQPPTSLDQIKGFIGDLARPFAIVSSSLAASWATIVIAYKVDGFGEAALFIGAVYAGVGALYVGKAWEVNTQAKQTAQVEIAKATTTEVK
jgi:hypothetical protein